jgi:hypothetical protein
VWPTYWPSTVAVCDKQVAVAGLINQSTLQKACSHQTVACGVAVTVTVVPPPGSTGSPQFTRCENRLPHLAHHSVTVHSFVYHCDTRWFPWLRFFAPTVLTLVAVPVPDNHPSVLAVAVRLRSQTNLCARGIMLDRQHILQHRILRHSRRSHCNLLNRNS